MSLAGRKFQNTLLAWNARCYFWGLYIAMDAIWLVTFLPFLLGVIDVGQGDVISKSSVTLQNNRYSGIVIAINPNVTEDPALVEAIKTRWTEASPVLFAATRSRAYLGDITILIPNTWNSVPYDETATGESYDSADVLIAEPNPSFGDAPYTLQYGRCGSKGSYTHFTPSYLKYDYVSNNFGPRGKVIVHEWAHYRWGVFDETDASQPFYDDPDGNKLMSVYDNQPLSYTQCSKDITVCCLDHGDHSVEPRCLPGYAHCRINPETGSYSDTCVCYLPNNVANVQASIMSYQYSDQIVTFCDDSSDGPRHHNAYAPNDQNRLCNLRSTWSVISESDDFLGTNNPNPLITHFTPTFTVKKTETNKRFVLVLDVSGSMGTVEPSGETRIQIANKAAAYFINTVPDGSLVGIVEFESQATTISNLYGLNSEANRNYLISKIPTNSGGGTCIGCGISRGIEVLEDYGNPAGGYVIVMTDGLGSLDTTTSNEAIAKGVVVESIIIYTTANEELVDLSLATGGSWFFASSDDLLSLIDAYGDFADPKDGDVTNKNYEITSETFKLDQYNPSYSSTVAVDSTIGQGTTFTYTWSFGTEAIVVTLSSPSGHGAACGVINSSTGSTSCADIKTDTTNKMLTITIKGTAESGTWRSSVSIPNTNSQTVSVVVTSKSTGSEPIIAESSVEVRDGIPIVYAKVSQGFNPVLGADVIATVSVQGGADTIVRLYDAGADPDIRRNDGIYSRYVTGIGTGRYSVKVRVESDYGGFSATNVKTSHSRATYNPGYYFPNGTLMSNPNGATYLPKGTAFGISAESLGNFSRQTSAGAFDYAATGIGDALPPSRVIDLTVRQHDFNNVSKGIDISFTAPGDDYDSGTASRYEIRYTLESPMDLVNNFTAANLVMSGDVVEGNISNPQSSGVLENLIVTTPDVAATPNTSVNIGFALKAYDEVNNEAQISNVATLRYYIQPPTFAAPTDAPTTDSQITVPAVTTTRSDTTIEVTTTSSSKDFKSSLLWLWTSIPIVILREFHQ